MLQEVKEFLKNHAVGYYPDGRPISREDIVERALASDEAIEQGDLISLDDLEEEAEKW